MEFDIGSVVSTPPLTSTSINTVGLTPAFTLFLYILTAVILIVALAFHLMKQSRPLAAVYKASIISFFSVGIIYAVHADIGWSRWISLDMQAFGGFSTEEKLSVLEDGVWDFARTARSLIPHDYVLYSSDKNIALRTEYFLLPLRKRELSDYIIVLFDEASHFDSSTKTFTRGDVKIGPVAPVLIIAPDTYILKRQPS
jgi:hypothetical protein